MIKTFLRAAGWGLLGLAVLAASLCALALAEPGWLLNSRTASAAARHLGKSYRPRWKSLRLAVGNHGFRTKRIVFQAENLCLSGEIDGCFPVLTLDATVRLGLSPLARVQRLETLIVRAGPVLKIDRRSSERKTRKEKEEPLSADLSSLIPAPLRSTTVDVVDVDVPRAEMTSSSGTTVVSLSASFSAKKTAPFKAEAYLVIPGTAPAVVSRYRADVSVDTDLLRQGSLSRLDARATLKGDEGLSAEIDAKLRNPRPDELALTASADARVSGRALRARLEGLYSARGASATAAVAVEDPRGPVARAALENCRLDAPLGKKGLKSADLRCAISIQPKSFGGLKRGALAGTLDLNVDFKRSGLRGDGFTAKLDASLGPDASWYGFFAKLRMKLAGRTGSLPESLTAEHELKTGFTVERFRDVVDGLARTDLAIPAPLDALKGRVTFEAHTSGDSRGKSQRIDYSGGTALASQKQRVNASLAGRLTIEDLFLPSRRIRDDTDVDLKDVALQLPYLKLGPMPNPMPDSRIKTGNPARDAAVDAERSRVRKSSSSAVAYSVHIRTGKPLILMTNLNKEPIPIALDLKAEPAGISGQVRVEPFDLKVFRQTAKVDSFALTLGPGGKSPGIDGKLVYKREDAVIDILILGTAGKPVVTFESKPPMTQDEIVSLLLYGKSPADLDSDQTTSAGTAMAGFTSGAFGLASLYLFASTPVDSVGYDPVTQTYQVSFKLPGGATLGVGANTEETKILTLRRRVARNVVLETELQENDPEETGTTGDAVTTFLEWFQRY